MLVDHQDQQSPLPTPQALLLTAQHLVLDSREEEAPPNAPLQEIEPDIISISSRDSSSEHDSSQPAAQPLQHTSARFVLNSAEEVAAQESSTSSLQAAHQASSTLAGGTPAGESNPGSSIPFLLCTARHLVLKDNDDDDDENDAAQASSTPHQQTVCQTISISSGDMSSEDDVQQCVAQSSRRLAKRLVLESDSEGSPDAARPDSSSATLVLDNIHESGDKPRQKKDEFELSPTSR